MPSSPTVNAGASSRALQPQAQDNQQPPPSSIQQGSLAGRSVIRQETTGGSCPHMPEHNASPAFLPKDVWAYDAHPTRRTVYQLQARDVIKAQQKKFVRALATCLKENVKPERCRESIKEMCRPVSSVAPAKLKWTIEDLIETANEVYPPLKLGSISDVKEGARALVESLFKEYGNKPAKFSWEQIIETAHLITLPTHKITFTTLDRNTFKEKFPLEDNETIASTKMLENIAAVHTLYNVALREFGPDVASEVGRFLDGQRDLDVGEIWRLDFEIKQRLFEKSNPEKYAESFVKYCVKMIEADLENHVDIDTCIKNLKTNFLTIESILKRGQQAQDAEGENDTFIWSKVVDYITSMPKMEHWKGKIAPSAEAIVYAIFNNKISIAIDSDQ